MKSEAEIREKLQEAKDALVDSGESTPVLQGFAKGLRFVLDEEKEEEKE